MPAVKDQLTYWDGSAGRSPPGEGALALLFRPAARRRISTTSSRRQSKAVLPQLLRILCDRRRMR